MHNLNEIAQAIRAKGLKEIKLPFDCLIVGAKCGEIWTFRIGKRTDLRGIIEHFFKTLPSDWIMLGLMDPSDRDFPLIGNRDGLLTVSRHQDFSEQFLDDVWVVLRLFYEYQVTLYPDFQKLCTEFINVCAYIQMLREPPHGHC
jgi:hypothetical protein